MTNQYFSSAKQYLGIRACKGASSCVEGLGANC